MSANKLALPDINVPYIWLPLNDAEGLAPVDYGNTGASWTAVNTSGTAWTDTPGFFTGSAGAPHNYIYTTNTDVTDLFNFLTGATESVGGRILFLSYKVNGAADDGVIFQLGSRHSSSTGYQILLGGTGDDLQMLVNGPEAETPEKILQSTAVPTSGESHICHMFDGKNGSAISWLNGIQSYNATDYDDFISFVNDITLTPEILMLLCRNFSTTLTPNPENPWVGGIKEVFAADLTTLNSPWQYAEPVMRGLYLGNKPPPIAEKW